MTAAFDAARAALAELYREWMAEMTTMPADPVKREAAIAEHLAARTVDFVARFMLGAPPEERK
jgi:hypothetical protein